MMMPTYDAIRSAIEHGMAQVEAEHRRREAAAAGAGVLDGSR